jgi:hypothetical protein
LSVLRPIPGIRQFDSVPNGKAVPRQGISPGGGVTHPRLASKAVDWFLVHEFVMPLLNEVGSWPLAGSPLWAALDDSDPMKLAAIYDAARQHALRIDTLQDEQSQIASVISAAGTEEGDWAALRRIVARGNGARIPRRKAS